MARSKSIDKERLRRAKSSVAKSKTREQNFATPSRTEADLFDGLRQGARNVAGVSWQIAVSVHLLVASFVGDLPFVRLTPEGLEDLDCQTALGDRIFVQMKEMGAGVGRFTAVGLAEALLHAQQIPGGHAIALLTDGELGSGLAETGWGNTLAAQPERPVQDVTAHLTKAGLTPLGAAELVKRAHLIRLPWNIRGETEALLTHHGLHPAVGGLVVGALYDEFTQTSAGQRTATLTTAKSHTPSDVDQIIIDIQSTVDLQGLDAAIRDGVCAPADYLHPSTISPGQFYGGVDGSPGAIAANLDVLRAAEMAQITLAIDRDRYALIVGPSGSGKSILLWRAARDVILGAHVVRVRRVSSSAEADRLVRHVKLLRPTSRSIVVVAADDLGRPRMAAWSEAVDQLREVNHVFIIGACREEDFDPSLVSRGAVLVQPRLDKGTARRLGEQIVAAGVQTAMNPAEAWERSRGLLMEFIALLTQAKRLDQVLAEQAVALRQLGREIQRGAARLITAAHSLGFGLTADQLMRTLVADGTPPEAVGDALDVLRGEHVVISEGTTWYGLHELRSRVLTAALHQSPPPTLTETWGAIARVLQPVEAGWLLRRIAEQAPKATAKIASSIASNLTSSSIQVGDVAQLLEGAERADNLIYARLTLPILERAAGERLSVRLLQGYVYSIRHQRLKLPRSGDTRLDAVWRQLEQTAASLPDRAATILDTVASNLSADRIQNLLSRASLAEAARLLEACAGLISFDVATASQVLTHLPAVNDTQDAAMFGRVIEALWTGIDPAGISNVIGTTLERAKTVVCIDPTCVGLEQRNDEDGLVVTVTTLLPPHDSDTTAPDWDSPVNTSSNDYANRHAVAIARRVASACPEADFVEIVTITPSGRRLTIPGTDSEPGYKRMPREAFPSRIGVRRNVGYQAALARLTAAPSWSALLAEQSEIARQLSLLITDALPRLMPDDGRSKRDSWAQRVAQLSARSQHLASRPVPFESTPDATHAGTDALERQEDATSEALRDVSSRLSAILEGNLAGTASFLRDSRRKLLQVRESGEIILGVADGLVHPITDDLIDGLERLAQLLLAVNQNKDLAREIDGRNLVDTVDRIISRASMAATRRQLSLLESVTNQVPGVTINSVADADPFPNALQDRAWLLTVATDGWNDLILALRTLNSDQRWSLGSNVVAVAMEEGEALPIAIKLAHSGENLEFPISREDLRPFVESAGLRLRAATDTLTPLAGIIDGLTALSWEAGRARARPSTWPRLPPPSVHALDDMRAATRNAIGELPFAVREATSAAMDVLIDQVETELLHADVPVSLAAEMFENPLADSHVGPAEAIWDAIAFVSSVSTLY